MCVVMTLPYEWETSTNFSQPWLLRIRLISTHISSFWSIVGAIRKLIGMTSTAMIPT